MKLPVSLEPLYSYAQHAMINVVIVVHMEDQVLGLAKTIYISREDVMRIMEMQPLSATCIIVYMRYLHDKLLQSSRVHMVGFCDPTYISGDSDHRSRQLATRLHQGSANQILLVPFISGNHWILTIINEDQSMCYCMDPIHSESEPSEWKSVVNNGIRYFNAQTGRGVQKLPVWKVLNGSKKIASAVCWYYVMRYMKEFLQGENLSYANKWDQGEEDWDAAYEEAELDEVGCEWASLVSNYM